MDEKELEKTSNLCAPGTPKGANEEYWRKHPGKLPMHQEGEVAGLHMKYVPASSTYSVQNLIA
jgi:hypothetical protein